MRLSYGAGFFCQPRLRFPGIYDPTEIHQQHLAKKHNFACSVKLGVYLILFFCYLYRCVSSRRRVERHPVCACS